jgi:hypothetical protein
MQLHGHPLGEPNRPGILGEPAHVEAAELGRGLTSPVAVDVDRLGFSPARLSERLHVPPDGV